MCVVSCVRGELSNCVRVSCVRGELCFFLYKNCNVAICIATYGLADSKLTASKNLP